MKFLFFSFIILIFFNCNGQILIPIDDGPTGTLDIINKIKINELDVKSRVKKIINKVIITCDYNDKFNRYFLLSIKINKTYNITIEPLFYLGTNQIKSACGYFILNKNDTVYCFGEYPKFLFTSKKDAYLWKDFSDNTQSEPKIANHIMDLNTNYALSKLYYKDTICNVYSRGCR